MKIHEILQKQGEIYKNLDSNEMIREYNEKIKAPSKKELIYERIKRLKQYLKHKIGFMKSGTIVRWKGIRDCFLELHELTYGFTENVNENDIPWLICASNDAQHIVSQQAENALIKMGKQAVEPLINILDNKIMYGYSAERAVGILVQIGKPAVGPLIKELKNKNEDIRSNIVKTLGGIGDLRAVPCLINALKDKEEGVRYSSKDALVRMKAVEPLIHASRKKDLLVKEYSIRALGEMGDLRAEKPLINLLDDRFSDIGLESATALTKLNHQKGLEYLTNASKDNNPNVRIRSAKIFGGLILEDLFKKIKEPKAIGPLVNLLGDVNWGVKKQAAEVLVKIGGWSAGYLANFLKNNAYNIGQEKSKILANIIALAKKRNALAIASFGTNGLITGSIFGGSSYNPWNRNLHAETPSWWALKTLLSDSYIDQVFLDSDNNWFFGVQLPGSDGLIPGLSDYVKSFFPSLPKKKKKKLSKLKNKFKKGKISLKEVMDEFDNYFKNKKKIK